MTSPTQEIRRALGIRGKSICTQIKFSPELAKKALDFHTDEKNRRHYERLSDRYAGAMERGEWQYNGESIKFTKEGKLIDGQHRLRAILKSNATIPLMVVLDLQPEAFHTIDTGRARSASDILAIRGERNCVLLAASLRLLGCYRFHSLEREQWYRIDHTRLLTLLDEEPNIRKSVNPCHNGRFEYTQKLLRPRVAIFCHYLFSTIDPDLTEHFYNKLADGLQLKRHEPVATLRSKLVDDLALPLDMRLNPSGQIAYTFIAFKATLDKEPLPKIKYQPFGKHPDKFPTL